MSGCQFPGPIPWAEYRSPVPLRPELDAAPVRAGTRRSNRENPARRWRSADPPPPFARAYPPGLESRLVSVSHPLWGYKLGAGVGPDTDLLCAADGAAGYSRRRWPRT